MNSKRISEFFNASSAPTSNESLAHLKDGTLISGYVGLDVKFYTHINCPSMLYTLEYLSSKHSSPYNIVETGCSSWGVSSTLLWDTFVSEFGGTVDSIDINMQNVEHARKAVSENTTIHCSDSVDFLLDYRKPIDLLYLDSFDCDFFRDNGSADHHLKEFKAVENLLKESSLILIDDTPINKHWLDNAMQRKDYDYLSETHVFYGKGNKIYSYLTQQTHSKLLLHTYQCLFEYYP